MRYVRCSSSSRAARPTLPITVESAEATHRAVEAKLATGAQPVVRAPSAAAALGRCRVETLLTESWFNQNGRSVGGIVWINYSDAGGDAQGAPPSNMCESIFESKGNGPNDRLYVIRSYLSVATLVFLRNSGDAAIENYCRDVQDFGDSSKHLNGIGNSGGQKATLWLRNNMVMVKRSDSTQLTDVIQMAADDGSYLGTGTNLDGSQGYTIKDNYLGGAAYVLQLGQDKSNTTTASLRSVNVTGNRFTTSLYPNSGQSGLGYKGPINWLVQGTWSNNSWADGANAAQTISSSAVADGP